MCVIGYVSIIIKDLADWFDGLHHVLLDIGIGLHLLQETLQHQHLLLQLDIPFRYFFVLRFPLAYLSILRLFSLFQLGYPLFVRIELFDCVSFLLLAEFGTLPVPADTLALLATAPFVPIEGTLVEQLRHLRSVEVAPADLAPQQKGGPEGALLKESGL
jgi:hypothetical protein